MSPGISEQRVRVAIMTHAKKEPRKSLPIFYAGNVIGREDGISLHLLHISSGNKNYLYISWVLSPTARKPDVVHWNWFLSPVPTMWNSD